MFSAEAVHEQLQEAELPEAGDPYLTAGLRELFVGDVIQPKYRNHTFVGLPATTLPESVDLRGSQGLATEEASPPLAPSHLTRTLRSNPGCPSRCRC